MAEPQDQRPGADQDRGEPEPAESPGGGQGRKRVPQGDGGDAAAGYGEIVPDAPAEEQRATGERLAGHGHSTGDAAGVWSDAPVADDEGLEDRPWPAE
jgi:hypothetical protein